MREPDWLKKAREEGRILSDTGVKGEVLTPVPISPEAAKAMNRFSESLFQQKVIDEARIWGWRVAHFRKVREQRKGGETYWETPVAADGKGFPDLVMLKCGRQGIAAELKVGRNIATLEQTAWLEAWAGVGFHAIVWKPEDWEEIVRFLSLGGPLQQALESENTGA